MSNTNPPDRQSATPRDDGTAGGFVYLDHALWQQFRNADTPEKFTSAWLALQCRQIAGADCGVVVLGEPDVGPFAPAAFWPREEAYGAELAAVAEEELGTVRRPEAFVAT